MGKNICAASSNRLIKALSFLLNAEVLGDLIAYLFLDFLIIFIEDLLSGDTIFVPIRGDSVAHVILVLFVGAALTIVPPFFNDSVEHSVHELVTALQFAVRMVLDSCPGEGRVFFGE